jgi:hypothetical protein
VNDSKPYSRRETVTFRAAYGDDRVVAHLYLPKNTVPPYQIVLFVPSGNSFFFQSIDTLPDPFEFLVRAGRATFSCLPFKGRSNEDRRRLSWDPTR